MLQSQSYKEGDVAKIAKTDLELSKCLNLDYRTVKKYNQALIDHNVAHEYIMQGRDDTGLNKTIKYVDMVKLQQAVLFNLAIHEEKISTHSEEISNNTRRIDQLEKYIKDLARDNKDKDKIIANLQSKINELENINQKEFDF